MIEKLPSDIINHIATYDLDIYTLCLPNVHIPKNRITNVFMYQIIDENKVELAKYICQHYTFEAEDYIWFMETSMLNENSQIVQLLLPYMISIYNNNPEYKEDIQMIVDDFFVNKHNTFIYYMCQNGYIPSTKNMRSAIETQNTPLIQYIMALDMFDPYGEEDSYTNIVYAIEHKLNSIVYAFAEYPDADLQEPDNIYLRTAIECDNKDAASLLLEYSHVDITNTLNEYELEHLNDLLIFGEA